MTSYNRILNCWFKVEVMSKADKSQKTETAFRLFDKNRDGYVTREEFTKVMGNERSKNKRQS